MMFNIKWNYLTQKYNTPCFICGKTIPQGQLCEWLMNNAFRHFECGKIYDNMMSLREKSLQKLLIGKRDEGETIYQKVLEW